MKTYLIALLIFTISVILIGCFDHDHKRVFLSKPTYLCLFFIPFLGIAYYLYLHYEGKEHKLAILNGFGRIIIALIHFISLMWGLNVLIQWK